MNQQELNTILDLHRKWLYDEEGGKRADLYGANLRHANLYGADLRHVNLYGANLYGADLYGADLRHVNLYGANLYDANLCGADLRHANLCHANLCGVNLYGADLYNANLCGADLCGANLYDANLRHANLYGADLYNANLYGADLCDVKNAALLFAQTCICPEKGSFIGFKKARYGHGKRCIIELEIPADAKRSNGSGRKCRASKARVVSITDLEGNPIDGSECVYSDYDDSFTYSNDVTVEPTEPFCEDRWNECASGIHFFMTREEAVDY